MAASRTESGQVSPSKQAIIEVSFPMRSAYCFDQSIGSIAEPDIIAKGSMNIRQFKPYFRLQIRPFPR